MALLVIHRPGLRQILLEEAKAGGAAILLSTTAEVHRTDINGGFIYATVIDEVVMAAGGPRHGRKERAFPADLVIAADGQQSEARALLTGQSNQPVPTGKMVNRILIGIDRTLAVGYLLKDVFNFVLTFSSEGESEVFLRTREVEEEELRAVF
ncbi:MAG: hypothetical protein LQ349_007243 [Xanthoria aureola]|nr:MAG: hypothetical protein LQ349_007243 [Xanthoria aureola]